MDKDCGVKLSVFIPTPALVFITNIQLHSNYGGQTRTGLPFSVFININSNMKHTIKNTIIHTVLAVMLVVAMFFAGSQTVAAQQPSQTDLHRMINDLLAQISILQNRLAEMENQSGVPSNLRAKPTSHSADSGVRYNQLTTIFFEAVDGDVRLDSIDLTFKNESENFANFNTLLPRDIFQSIALWTDGAEQGRKIAEINVDNAELWQSNTPRLGYYQIRLNLRDENIIFREEQQVQIMFTVELQQHSSESYTRWMIGVPENGFRANGNSFTIGGEFASNVLEVDGFYAHIRGNRNTETSIQTCQAVVDNALQMAVGNRSVDIRYDINGDGRVTAIDSLELLRMHNNLISLTPSAQRVFRSDCPTDQTTTPVPVDSRDQTPSCTLTASESTILRGQSTTLTWDIENAESAILNIRGGQEVLNDSNQRRIVLPRNDYTFRLTIVNDSGQSSECTAFVQVIRSDRNSSARCELSLSKDTISIGESTRLTWDVENAISARLTMPRGTQEVLNDSNKQRWVLPHRDYIFRMEVLDNRERSFICEREVKVVDSQAKNDYSTTITTIQNTVQELTAAIAR